MILEVHIQDVGFGGKGVARHAGKVIFVPFVIPGEKAAVRITRERKKFAEAELVQIIEPSPDRVEPKCPYFGVCGGCAYQHIAYDRQLQLKAEQVSQLLRRIGKIDPVPMRPAVAVSQTYAYRNRIRVHAAGGIVGFFSKNRESLIDIARCPISTDEVNSELERFRRTMTPDREGDFLMSGREFRHFEQTNDEMAAQLLSQVRGMVGPAQKTLVDAYCGAGFFAFGMRDLFDAVIGIEENGVAIAKARAKAQVEMRFIEGDVSVELPAVLEGCSAEETTVLLDPPAAGLGVRVLESLVSFQPSEIIYVSCDPGTLARDLFALRQTYTVKSVTPLDMFPQTAEIETIVYLCR